MTRVLVIPAAGSGTRLKSALPKLLVPVAGKPMIDRLFELYREHVQRVVLVVAPSALDQVRGHVAASGLPVDLALQPEPTGMLDAILLAGERVREADASEVWITWCDQVAVCPETVRRLSGACSREVGAAAILPTVRRAEPYIHFERNGAGAIARVLQRREGDSMPAVGEADMGLFRLSAEAYFEWLPRYAGEPPTEVNTGAATGERNFLPFFGWLHGRGVVHTVAGRDPTECVGVNTPEELRLVEEHLRRSATLSVVVPAFNEERTIAAILERIRAVDLSGFALEQEILVVDDGSRDRTAEIARGVPGVRVLRQEPNQGKGAAVRRGIGASTGAWVIVQDADLEYEPDDYAPMLAELFESGADAVYGSRYLEPNGKRGLGAWLAMRHPEQSWAAYLGGRSLSFVALACTGRYLTDTVTALKLVRGELVRALPLETSGFELDHELTARLLARGGTIREVPISYHPRSRAEGKKIGLHDWFRAVSTFRRYRKG